MTLRFFLAHSVASMQYQGHKVEILSWGKYDDGEWYEAKLACDGHLCLPVYFHAQQIEQLTRRERIEPFLCRKAVELLELYGDVRDGIPPDQGDFTKEVETYGTAW